MSTYPKSPREMTTGMMWFPRLTDKIRLFARADLAAEYHTHLGERFDARCLSFLRVDYAPLRERVLAGTSDEEALEWCYENGRRLNDVDLLVWNSFVEKFGWNDVRAARLEQQKAELGVAERADILTLADLLDYDEKRMS
ncbi:MAG: DUF5069 domain-containing protein [Chthoniobacterales bacterium]